MMGEMSGFKMARIIRENPRTADTPIIFLTAKSTENDRLTGFMIGADDYILKPFSVKEVIARIKAVIRRLEFVKSPLSLNIYYDKLEINLLNKKVLLDNTELVFTKKEFEILKIFLENRNQVFTREELLEKVWPEDVCVQDRTIDVNINRLRKKIDPYGKNIVTRLGYGYCFED